MDLCDCKILRHKMTGGVKLIMPSELTGEVRADVCLQDHEEHCNLQPDVGNDTCWVWSAQESSNGSKILELAMKVETSEQSQTFKNIFDINTSPTIPAGKICGSWMYSKTKDEHRQYSMR